MKRVFRNRLISLGVLCGGVVFLGLTSGAAAQSTTPFLLTTWQSLTEVPAGYAGKALVSSGSSFRVAVEAVDRGQVINLKTQLIRWYLDDKMVKSGVGMQTASFSAQKLSGNTMKIRVEVPEYTNAAGTKMALSKTVFIPVVAPEVVITSLFPRAKAAPQAFEIQAVPYFFSRSLGLDYRWLVNGTAVPDGASPQTLKISFPPSVTSGTLVSVRVETSDPLKATERAVATKQFIMAL